MEERASGIIIRTRPLTETSLIVQWITPEFGRISAVAKGARRKNSSYAGKLDLYFQTQFTFQRSRRSELHNLREVAVLNMHPELRRDIALLQKAAYATNLIELATETETPIPEISELFASFISSLATMPFAGSVLGFEIKLLHHLGFEPDLARSFISPGAKKMFEALLRSSWAEVGRLRLSTQQVDELTRYLMLEIARNFGRIPELRESALKG